MTQRQTRKTDPSAESGAANIPKFAFPRVPGPVRRGSARAGTMRRVAQRDREPIGLD